VLSACASSGHKVNPTAISQFENGKTTYEQVIAALGAPTTDVIASDGKRTFIYSYAEYKTRPETFIPYIGAFVGGSDVASSAVIFKFAANGTLVDYSSANSQRGIGLGLAGGS
jgi:outer membrane protein assembly factor BamE (lipoprotein component of BamABCDE complex)